jgi:hypothetical protein
VAQQKSQHCFNSVCLGFCEQTCVTLGYALKADATDKSCVYAICVYLSSGCYGRINIEIQAMILPQEFSQGHKKGFN